jgi:hypothetical protein
LKIFFDLAAKNHKSKPEKSFHFFPLPKALASKKKMPCRMKQSKRKSTGGKVLVIQHGERASQQVDVKQEEIKQEDGVLGFSDDDNGGLGFNDDENGGLGFSDEKNEGLGFSNERLGFSDDYGPPRPTKKPRLRNLSNS